MIAFVYVYWPSFLSSSNVLEQTPRGATQLQLLHITNETPWPFCSETRRVYWSISMELLRIFDAICLQQSYLIVVEVVMKAAMFSADWLNVQETLSLIDRTMGFDVLIA